MAAVGPMLTVGPWICIETFPPTAAGPFNTKRRDARTLEPARGGRGVHLSALQLVEQHPPHRFRGSARTGRSRLAGDASYAIRPGDRYYVQNLLEELDAPGEWYLDRRTETLYFWPPAPLAGKLLYAPTLRTLIEHRAGRVARHHPRLRVGMLRRDGRRSQGNQRLPRRRQHDPQRRRLRRQRRDR